MGRESGHGIYCNLQERVDANLEKIQERFRNIFDKKQMTVYEFMSGRG